MDVPGGRSLWLIRADGTELHELAPGQPVDGKTNPVWSRDGTHIAFESVDPRRLVYETDVDGSAISEVWTVLLGLLDDPNPASKGRPRTRPTATSLRPSSTGTPDAEQVIYVRHA